MLDSIGYENYDWYNFPSLPFEDISSSFNTVLPWDQDPNTAMGSDLTTTSQAPIKLQDSDGLFDVDAAPHILWDFNNANDPAGHVQPDLLDQPMTSTQWNIDSYASSQLTSALNSFQPNPTSNAVTLPHVRQTTTPSHNNSTKSSHEPSILNVCAVQSTNNPRVFVFRCTFPRCRTKTFGRWSDFHRHYNGAHATEKTMFWCPIAGCVRSEGTSNRGFPRKDKMMNHVWKIHNNGEDDMKLEAIGDEDVERDED